MYRMLNITVQRLEKTGAFLSDMVTWGEEARRRAVTDEMTGVYNRRFLEDVVVDHFRAAQREGTPLSLIMVDLDRFREINEGYGKEMGDRVIMEAVKIFRTHLRDTDIIARYGGDEFTVMLPSTSLSAARELAERICRDVHDLPVLKEAGGGKIDTVTTSQGVAAFPECAKDLKALRAAADGALYRAKEAGKDQVACAPAQDGTTR
jgi:diguanylate cyclase (GGDEF)-like protein